MPKFYDELGEASLENLASDPSNLPEGRVWKNSTSQLPKVAIGGAVKELITNDATQTLSNKTISGASNTITNVSGSNVVNTPSGNLAATDVQAALNELQSDVDTRATSSSLTTHTSATTSVHGITDTADLLTTSNAKVVTNKDIDGGTASNTNRVTIPKDTLANLQALTRKEGTIVYATDTDKFYSDNGTTLVPVGSGSGAKNYFTDGDSEGANPFTLFNDGSAIWVDGTGGSPTATITQSATTPLSGQKSFLFTSGAQYDTAKASITIDREDKYKVVTLEAAYENVSGTYADGDLQILLYDSTNGAILYPTPVHNLQASGTNAKQQFAFQATDSLTYQILIHQKTSATFSMRFEMKIGPQQFAGYAPMMSDMTPWTPSFTGTTATAIDMKWARRGENLYAVGTWTNSVSGGTITFTLPNGLTIDSSKISSSNYQTVGSGGTNGGYFVAVLAQGGLGTLAMGLLVQTTTDPNIPYTGFGTTDKFQINFEVPITGWSSESKVISEYDGRRVSATAYVNTGYTPAANDYVNFDTIVEDSHGCVTTGTGTSWRYTAKVSGKYSVKVTGSSPSNLNIRLFKNGAVYSYLTQFTTGVVTGVREVVLAVGDYISVEVETSVAIRGYDFSSYQMTAIDISLLSGSQQIVAGERIVEKGYYPFGTTVTNGTAIGGLTIKASSHGALNFTTGVFTAPRSDWYRIKFCMHCGPTTTPFSIYVNGTQDAELFISNSTSMGGGNDTVYLSSGDTLDIRSNVNATSANGGAGGKQYLEVMSGAW